MKDLDTTGVSGRGVDVGGAEADTSVGPSAVTLRLLDAAVDVFGDRGFEAAGVAEIARRANLTTGAIYARWSSKREMFMAAVKYAAPKRMLSQAVQSGDPPPAVIGALGANLLSNEFAKYRDLMLEAVVSARRDPSLTPIVHGIIDTDMEMLQALVSRGKDEGFIDPAIDTDVLAIFIYAVGLGTHLLLSTQSAARGRPCEEAWFTLVSRLMTVVAPA